MPRTLFVCDEPPTPPSAPHGLPLAKFLLEQGAYGDHCKGKLTRAGETAGKLGLLEN